MQRIIVLMLAALTLVAAQARADYVPLVNPSFEEGVAEDGLPTGWSRYSGPDEGQSLTVVDGGVDGGRALLIEDGNANAEIGVFQDFPLEGGQNALVTVSVRRVGEASSAGAYLQFRFFPSNTFEQTSLAAQSAEEFNVIRMFVPVPEGTTEGRIYLYTHEETTPKVMVDNVTVESGVEPPAFPEGPAPEPVPPQFDQLKELHLTTPLVAGGEAQIAIVAPADRHQEAARAIQAAIRELAGVDVPIVADDADEAGLPPAGHLIALGNRSTNRIIQGLYERFYTLLDLKYPGPGGHVVRTLHSPFGDGLNVILVGGSDDDGVAEAARAFVGMLRDAGAEQGELSVGWLRDIQLGEGYQVPRDPTEMQIWEASNTYGSSGYFGWNIISKHMAAFYMTGDEYHAREFLRLAFPDEQAIAEIEELDGERIENKHDPLAGPYHYAAHMMILFWDLIEEDPFFTDEQRLEITNAFARQLTHRAHEGVYGRTTPSAHVGNRHGDWAAMSLYVLARYFRRDYPDPIWDCAKTSVDIYFDGIENSAWLAGNNDHLFWYTSYYDPLLDYMHLSGDRGGMGNLRQALKTQDILFTGREDDWGLRASSLNFLHRAADITGDGRFIFYRDRTGLDTDILRLGQSWWPDDIEARPPTELLHTWTIQPMPEPMWRARGSGIPLDRQFLWGTWRTTLDGTGDLLMIKGHNGGGRLPYHTFSVIELRLADYTLLKGYRNQVLTSADGMVEPTVAMDSALLDHGVIGDIAYAVGEVPEMAFCNWRRSVLQREGHYTIFVDDLTFRTDSDNVKVETEWQTVGGHWDAARNAVLIQGSGGARPEGYVSFSALDADVACGPGTADELLSDLTGIDIVLLKAHEPGTWMEMPFTLDKPIVGQIFCDLLNYKDRGILRISLDGEALVEGFDHQAPAAVRARADLGEHALEAGEHVLRVEVTGGHEGTDRMFVGLVGLSVRPEGVTEAPGPLGFELHPSRVMNASGGGTVVMQWLGSATEGQHRRFFHLLAPKLGDEALEAYQIAESAAVMSLPRPALAVGGEFEGIAADVALLAEDHAVALGMTRLPFASANVPVDLRWDFEDATLIVSADQQTELTIAGEDILLEPGTHTLEDMRLGDRGWVDEIAGYLQEARAERERQLLAAAQPRPVEAPEMAPATAGAIGGKPVAAEVIPHEGSDLIALAEGQTVHVLDADGSEQQALQADGPIRVLRWWAEHGLLLVGCEDEQVIAFDLDTGERRWVFVSEMHQAVWEAGKQYWFKSAYPGIHGLHTGQFIGGESQAFVGSACTLEIIDHEGGLVERLPVFWGNGWKFQLIDGPDESRNLLIARWPNGTDTLAVINSETLSVGKSFYGVPGGHTMVGGWSAQNRTGIEYVDVDGDGEREVVTATNGVWNRVTVFSGEGAPLFNAQFGPGPSKAPYTTMRDLTVADLDGDGDMEIITGIADGLVVALDHECRRAWATRLPSPPTQLQVVTPAAGTPAIIAGCEDGSMVRLTGAGEIAALGHAGGRVETLVTIATDAGPMVIATTADGAVSGYLIGRAGG